MLVLLSMLLPDAHARDILHVALSHEWSERFTRDAGELGPSLKLDVGYGVGVGLGKIIPEIGVGYAYANQAVVPRVGGRAILGWLLTPGVYAHVNSGIGGPFATPVLGFDGGVTLDVSLPYVRFGGFAGIQVFGGPTGPDIPDQNWTFGLEIALSLPTGKDDVGP